MAEPRQMLCASCGIPLLVDVENEQQHEEALKMFGRRGDSPGMVIVCDHCFFEVVAQMKLTKGES